MSIMIIDYGMGNLGSVHRALEEAGAAVFISDNPDDIKESTALLLPGVGAFAEGANNLNTSGMSDSIKEATLDQNIPLLGICLGMQLLATSGEEGADTEACAEGLNLIPGAIKRINPQPTEKLPHIGWNEVTSPTDHAMFNGIKPGTDFYFVHSYHYRVDDQNVVGSTPFAGGITSAVARDSIWGVQFHPEKSSKPGLRLLENFISASS